MVSINPFELLDNRLGNIELLLKKLSEHKDYQTAQTQQEAGVVLLTRKQAAKMLGVCLTTIDSMSKKGVLKKHKSGGRIVRFRKEELFTAFKTYQKYQRGLT
jgi:excisionase family DNA binding protein